MKKIQSILLGLGLLILAPLTYGQGKLNIYNWSDYIAEDTLSNFEKRTGIQVVYDTYDSNEVLEAKLLTGGTGYDLVFPSADFMAKQIQAGVYQPIDKSKLSNYDNLDKKLLALVSNSYDKDNQYGVPYMWGTSAIGYNPDKIKAVLGEDAPLNTWDLLFKPEIVSRLQSCGVSLLDAPTEVVGAALHYLGLDPNSERPDDYKKAEELLKSIAPYITYFHSSRYISDLANGDICIAMGFSGDIFIAADRAEEAGSGIVINYVIPKEGALLWFDMMGIPADAKNADNAYKFINYILEPKVVADITNYVSYANPNPSSNVHVDPQILQDTGIYPDPATRSKLWTSEVLPARIDRLITRTWTSVKSAAK